MSKRLILGLISLAAASIGLVTGSSSSAARGARVRHCAPSELRLVSRGGGPYNVGRSYTDLYFSHRGPGRCALEGYPGVTMLKDGKPLRLHVSRYDNADPKRVIIGPKKRAGFSFVWRAFDYKNKRRCQTRVNGLRVIPPDARRALTVRLHRPAALVCRRGLHAVDALDD